MNKRIYHNTRTSCLLAMLPAAVFICTLLILINRAYAVPLSYDTGESVKITASGIYDNWDGVTNAAQFTGPDGSLYFAVDSETSVTVYKTDEGKPVPETVTLEKQHPLFGTAICDDDGNFYLVTGEANSSDDTSVETIFITKYDSNGNLINTTGDNGRSSLDYYYEDSFNTAVPFDGGNCDAAISGSILTVNYARKMYSGHQSNSVFSVNMDDMTKVSVGTFYESHSFAQRVVPTADGFVYMSEGDCYDRSFTAYCVKTSEGSVDYSNEQSVFDFWVREGAYDEGDMYEINNNFAHMGGLAPLPNGNIAFVSRSAKSLSENAKEESEEIFVQIFDPYEDLTEESSYVTEGTRSGLAGNNGTTDKTNYGVKWLTSYGSDSRIENVQTTTVSVNKIAVLYELYQDYNYKGVYYILLDEDGEEVQPATLFSASAKLNPCEMPVSFGDSIYWVGNRYGDPDNKVYVYNLNTLASPVTIDKDVTAIDDLTYTGEEQILVNAGDATGGEFQYALGDDALTPPDDDKYDSSVPVGKEAGSYYVWFRIIGDNSHYDTIPECITVTINNKPEDSGSKDSDSGDSGSGDSGSGDSGSGDSGSGDSGSGDSGSGDSGSGNNDPDEHGSDGSEGQEGTGNDEKNEEQQEQEEEQTKKYDEDFYLNPELFSISSKKIELSNISITKPFSFDDTIYRITVERPCIVSFHVFASFAIINAELYDSSNNILWIWGLTNKSESTDLKMQPGTYFFKWSGCLIDYKDQEFLFGSASVDICITKYLDFDTKVITVSDNKPMNLQTVQVGNYYVTYSSEIPFYGKKISLIYFDSITVSKNGTVSRNVIKAKINKKKHIIQITKVDGFSKVDNKAIKTATKGLKGLSFSVNPYWVKQTDDIVYKKNKNGDVTSVKIRINSNYYKAKKSEFHYNYNTDNLTFSGNLAGSYSLQ